jgi:hypothetical protein
LKDIAFGAGTTTYSYAGNSSGGTLTIRDAQGHTANLSLVGNYTNSTFTLSSDGHGGTIAIDPPKDGFNFALNPTPASVPTTPTVTIGGAGNDAFVFHQPVGGASTSPGLALDGPESKAESSGLTTLANNASDHQWIDAVHVAGVDHTGSIGATDAHIAELQAGHFLLH